MLDQLDRYAVPIRRRLGVDRLGLGLWLAAAVAAELAADASARRRLREALAARGLEVLTLNAFPYRGFHEPVVKQAVYRPDWTDPARAAYTVDCARVLADLLPDDAGYGSISTLPLGWRTPWDPQRDAAARCALAGVADELGRLDRPVRLAVEPEPGCVLDTVEDTVAWLAGAVAAGDVDPGRVGVCLDTCHLAVSFADPAGAVHRIRAAGLDVVKVQASAALHVEDPSDPAARSALEAFAEPRYLHQVRVAADGRVGAGRVGAADDLPEALRELPTTRPWRVHVHVPLHLDPAPPLTATTGVLRTALDRVLRTTACEHVEVETYTWGVLPEAARPRTAGDLVAGIAGELTFAATMIRDLGAN